MKFRRLALALAAAGLGAVGLLPMSAHAAGSAVSGGGASFPQLELEQWRADTARKPYSLQFNYAASGSGAGRNGYIQGSFDYGVSDIPFQPEEAANLHASGRDQFVYVPVSAGGLAFMYNVIGTDGQRITNLKLSARNVCRVFTVPGIRWNDPDIVAENSGVALPDLEIGRVVRSDSSGTTFVLSEYCQTVVPAVWTDFINFMVPKDTNGNLLPDFKQGRPISVFPQLGTGAQGSILGVPASDGVANAVASPDAKGFITYVETGFAKVRSFPVASVQNAAGVYIAPDAHAVSVALAYATPVADGTFSLEYARPDAAAYFPSTYSYVIAQTNGFDPGKGLTLATYLDYAVTKGQDVAEPLGYARLSSVLVNTALDRIAQIPGAPPRPQAPASAPPTPTTLPPTVTTSTTTSGGGPAGGGSTGGGSTGGGSTGGGSTGGGSTGGGSTPGGSTGGGSPRTTIAGAGQQATDAGGQPANSASTIAGQNGQTQSTLPGTSVTVPGGVASPSAVGATPSAGAPLVTVPKKGSAPSNSQVLWTMLEGAAFVGLGLGVSKTRTRLTA
jgi:phosphate transport system substrate-binding protein